jgi:hypothetical protein
MYSYSNIIILFLQAKVLPALNGFEAAERYLDESNPAKGNVLLKKFLDSSELSAAGVSLASSPAAPIEATSAAPVV